jgi:tetratricopeptide (TPR) repeat protein
MAKRYFNWKLAIVLVIGFAVLGVTAYSLRQWQKTTRAERALVIGEEAYAEGRWDEAAKNLGRYLAVERESVPILLKYAEAQLKVRPAKPSNLQRAIAAYRNVLRLDKSNSEAAMRLTEIYLGVGSPGEAELIAGRYLEENEDPAMRRLFAWALAGQLQKFDEAVAEFKGIVAEHPGEVLSYQALGQLAKQRPGDISEPPEHWFNEAVRKNPSNALAYIARAGFHLQELRVDEAVADLEQAERQDISDPQVRLRLATEFVNARLLDKAEEHLRAVQAATPRDQRLWQTWVLLALRSANREKMLQVAETGLKELASQPWDFMPAAVELFVLSKEIGRANECVSQMKEKDVAPHVTAFLEGMIADVQGRPVDAVKHWRNAIALGNNTRRIRLALATSLVNLGDNQSALAQLRTLATEQPTSYEARLVLAKLLARVGNWPEAAEHARAAMQISPDEAEPALLNVQARIHMLADRSADETNPMWQDIESELSALEKASDGALEVRLLQVRVALERADFAGAGALLAPLEKEHPDEVRVAMMRVELLVAEAKDDEAVSLLEKTVDKFPESFEPVRYLAALLNQQGNREKCEEVVKRALARREQPAAQRLLGMMLAELYTQWEELDRAYEHLSTLVQKFPHDVPLKRRFLACKQVLDDPERLQGLIDEIKSIEGEEGWQWRYEQARAWFISSEFKARYPEIVSILQENLLANADDQGSRLLLAAAYDRAGELQLAVSTYREALSRSPRDVRIIVPFVAALYAAKEDDEAEEILSRAARQKLHHPQLQGLQLQSHLRRGQLGSASDILQEYISDDPNNRTASLTLALLKIQQEQYDEAGALLEGLRVGDPNSLPIASAQIQLNTRRGQTEEALKICDEIVGALGTAPAYLLRARTYVTLGLAERAVEDFARAVAAEPNNPSVWVARSDFRRSAGRSAEAAADIERALSLAPDSTQIQRRAVVLMLASGDPNKVRQGRMLLDEALEANPDDVELRLARVRLHLDGGTAADIADAERILKEITDNRPATSEAWVLLGQILLQQALPGEAVDVALRGLAHKPDDKRLLLLKARAEAARSPVLAIPTLRALHAREPNDVDIAIRLADAYVGAGQPARAVSLLTEQLGRCDVSTERGCRVALAIARYKNGDKAVAESEFDSLLQSVPGDPGPLLVLVRLLRDDKLWEQLDRRVTEWLEKRPEDNRTPVVIAGDVAIARSSESYALAEDILQRVLERDPNNVPAMSTLAMVYQSTGRGSESAKLCRQILEIAPDNVIAMNNLAWTLCEEQGKYQEALDLAQNGVRMAPEYADIIDTRGVIYYRLDDFDNAIRDFNKCVDLYPRTAPSGVAARFHLARALAKAGQASEAVKCLNQALDLAKRIGGLSAQDTTEAQQLLEQLQKGS